MTRTILVDRLLEFSIDTFSAIGLSYAQAKKRLHKVPIQTEYTDTDSQRSNRDWNIGRIAFFVEKLARVDKLDPIEVDSDVFNGNMYGPVIIDGFHRLCATVLAQHRTIRANFSGRTDVLDYLTGKRKCLPEDL